MKKLHKFKVDAQHFIIVFNNGSKSNYDRFIAVYENGQPKQAIWGTTIKNTLVKEDILKIAKHGINLYIKQK